LLFGKLLSVADTYSSVQFGVGVDNLTQKGDAHPQGEPGEFSVPVASALFSFARADGRLPLVAYEIHIKTADGGVVYPSAYNYGRKDGDLWVQVGDDADRADTIYFAPGYWQQYVVNPHSEDPLDLDLIFEDADYADYEEDDDYEGDDGADGNEA